jgi:chromate reductase, NAD(P)H dehydrogenase (quinone)
MAQRQVALVVGSLRRESINRKLANAVLKLAPPDFAFKELKIDDLPPYNQDDDANPSAPVRRLKSDIKASDALLFVTPEYNRSVPGVLKNAIDHASRPYGHNAWAGKPAGILSASIGAVGGAMAQQHLRNILTYLDVPTLNQPEVFIHVRDDFFDAGGAIANPDSKKFLQGWVDRYAMWVKRLCG